MSEALKARMADFTTAGYNFNAWPDIGEIVEVIRPDGSPKDCYDLGVGIGLCSGVRAIRMAEIPTDILMMLPPQEHPQQLIHVHYKFESPRGNAANRGPRNVEIYFPPRWKAGYAEFTGLIVQVGCQHQFKGSLLGNCWRGAECSRCGQYYEIDSSG
jgi:hypothetical protein